LTSWSSQIEGEKRFLRHEITFFQCRDGCFLSNIELENFTRFGMGDEREEEWSSRCSQRKLNMSRVFRDEWE
jgi:hypothetical protein